MRLLRTLLGDWPAYLWSGWGALASLLLLFAGWHLAAEHYGSLVLAQPLEAFASLGRFWAEGSAVQELAITGRRALSGLALALLIGSALGLAAGVSMTASMMSRPLVTVLLGLALRR